MSRRRHGTCIGHMPTDGTFQSMFKRFRRRCAMQSSIGLSDHAFGGLVQGAHGWRVSTRAIDKVLYVYVPVTSKRHEQNAEYLNS